MSKQTKLALSCSRFRATTYSYFKIMSQSKQQKALLFLGPERTFNTAAMHNMELEFMLCYNSDLRVHKFSERRVRLVRDFFFGFS
jgi:hypothetical protein